MVSGQNLHVKATGAKSQHIGPANQHHSTFRLSKGGASTKYELYGAFESEWEERCCINGKHPVAWPEEFIAEQDRLSQSYLC